MGQGCLICGIKIAALDKASPLEFQFQPHILFYHTGFIKNLSQKVSFLSKALTDCHLTRKLQAVFVANFINLVQHILGIGIGIVFVLCRSAEISRRFPQGFIRVIALLKIHPLPRRQLVFAALRADYRNILSGFLGSGNFAAVPFIAHIRKIGDLLHPQVIQIEPYRSGTSHQQCGNGNNGGNKPQFPGRTAGLVLLGMGRLGVGFLNVAIPNFPNGIL